MTKKHYVAIASIIRKYRTLTINISPTMTPREIQGDAVRGTADAVGYALADYLQSENERFDRARFLSACGITSE